MAESECISIVVPTRNESGNIEALHRRLAEAMHDHEWSLIVVDDSDDCTVDVLSRIACDDRRVRVLHREPDDRRGGLGTAVVMGILASTTDVIVVMDGDLQHPPESVPSLLSPILQGDADLVIGSRYVHGGESGGLDGQVRRLGSRACGALAHLTIPASKTVRDPMSGFFAIRRSVVADVPLHPNGYKILLEILARGNWKRLVEIPFAFARRDQQVSKSGVREGLRYLSHLSTLIRRVPPDAARSAEHNGSMKVLIITSEAPPEVSGIARITGSLATGLERRGHTVDIITRADFPKLMCGEVRLSSFVFFWPQIKKRLYKYDIIDIQGPAPTMSDVFLALRPSPRSPGRPAIVYHHHCDLAIPGWALPCRVYNALSPWLAHRADVIISSSRSYTRKLASGGSTPVETIPIGIPTQGIAHTPNDGREERPLQVLFVGQFRRYKGIDVLIRAAAGQRHLEVSIVGDGPLRSELQALADDLNASNIVFHGRVSDEKLWDMYRSHDVIALPSLTPAEAFGIVLVEGMVASCVPVASDLPGVREVAGRTGIIVQPGNVDQLRRALVRLASDRTELSRLQEMSRQRAETMNATQMVQEVEGAFHRAAARQLGSEQHRALPRGWRDASMFLASACRSVGVDHASLTLFSRRGLQPRALWFANGESYRISSAPVARFAARSAAPLLIGTHAYHGELGRLLTRPELNSSLLVPVRRTSTLVSVLAVSTNVGEPELTNDHLQTVLAMM